MLPVKVGFCIAYDWEMLRYSIPLVYKHANSICLSLDANRVSWAGEKFDFNSSQFQSFISEIDTEKKISVLEEDFYNLGLSPMQNEVGQRNRMADFLGKGGWHIQLDCDEYFTNFELFVRFLAEARVIRSERTNICCGLITIFKKVSNGFLIVDRREKCRIETIAVATTKPLYEYGRRNGYFNYHTAFNILHQSWARSEEDILIKVKNWGHKNDFDIDQFIAFWKSLNSQNFDTVRNFHPIDPGQWPALKFVEARSIENLIAPSKFIDIVNFSKLDLAIRNSRIVSKIKSIIK